MGSWFHKFLPFRISPKSADRPRKRKPSRRRPTPLQLEELETRVVPANILWTGAAGDLSWNNHDNWSTGAVPGSGDDVSIAANQAVYFSSGNAGIRSLTGGGNLNITGGTFAVGQVSGLNMLTLSGGTAEFDGSLQLTALIQTGGTFTGSGAVTVSGPATWSGGTMSGSGKTTLQGPFILGSADANAHAETLDGRALIVQGPINESGSGTLSTVNRPDLVLPPSAPLSVPTAPGSYTISYQDVIVNGLDPILTRTYSGTTLVGLTAHVDNADGSSTSYEWDYNSDGSLSAVDEITIKAGGSSTISQWNYTSGGTLTRVTQATNGSGSPMFIEWDYTSDGTLAQIISTTTNADHSVKRITWSYNADGSLGSVDDTVSHTDGSGTSTLWSYASGGILSEITEQITNVGGSGSFYDWIYNSDGSLSTVSIVSPGSPSPYYYWAYNSAGTLTAFAQTIINADGSATDYVWDYASDGSLSDISEVISNADGSSTSYGWSYNSDGSSNISDTLTNADGSTTSYGWSYNSDGILYEVDGASTKADGSTSFTFTWIYNNDGTSQVKRESFNADGTLTLNVWQIDSDGSVSQFSDGVGNIDGNGIFSGVLYSWTYNSDGSLAQVNKTINSNVDIASSQFEWDLQSDGTPFNINEYSVADDGSSIGIGWGYASDGSLQSVGESVTNTDGSTTFQEWSGDNLDGAPAAPSVPPAPDPIPSVPVVPIVPVAPVAPSIPPPVAPVVPSPPAVPQAPTAPTDYVVVTTPSDVTVDTPFDVTATVYTTLDDTVDTTYTGDVTIALANDPNGDTTLGGTTTIKIDDGSGMADFNDLTLDQAGTGFTLQVTGDSLTPATTDGFDVNEKIHLSVTTPDSEAESGPQFGPYLPGVELSVTFTVSADDPGNQVAYVTWSVSGSTKTATPSGDSSWTFEQDVSVVQSGKDLPLIVTAYDSSDNKLDTFNGTLHALSDPLTFDLTGSAPGSGPQPVSNLRFINSVSLSETFTGTIGNLPEYYDDDLTAKLGFDDWPVTFQSTNGGVGFTITTDAGQLPVGPDFVSVLVGSQDISVFGAPTQMLDSEPVPQWLQNIQSNNIFLGGTYHFTSSLALPDSLSQLAIPDEVWFGGGSESGISAQATVSVAASLSPNDNPTVTGALTGSLTFMGSNLKAVNIQLPAGGVQLDGETLEIQTFNVSLTDSGASTVSLFAGQLFSKPPFQVKSNVQADISYSLAVNLAVKPDGTLDSGSNVECNFTANLSGTVDVPGFTVGSSLVNGVITKFVTGISIPSGPAGLAIGAIVNYVTGKVADAVLPTITISAGVSGAITLDATADLNGSLGSIGIDGDPDVEVKVKLTPATATGTFTWLGQTYSVKEDLSDALSIVYPSESADLTAYCPVGLLLTDSQGQRLGYDPTTGSVVNDFGTLAYYSGLGTEPQVLEISMGSVVLGSYQVVGVGTASGPYLIDLQITSEDDPTQPVFNQVIASGVASPGQPIAAIAPLDMVELPDQTTADGTTTTLVSDHPTGSAAGNTDTFTATVSTGTATTPTGWARFEIDGSDYGSLVPLTGGTASISLSTLPAGQHTITANYVSDSDSFGTSDGTVTQLVNPGPATHFAVISPANAALGTPFAFTVQALDSFGNTATGYTGTVHFTSLDFHATLPPDAALTSGVGTFNATLQTIGSQTITSTDTATNIIAGTSNSTNVSDPPTHFVVGVPGAVTAGRPFVIAVTAEDQFNNTASSYNGTVQLTSSDNQAAAAGAIPGNVTLTNGFGFFAAALETAGTQTITATDTTISVISASSGIAVTAAGATHFSLTAALSSYPGVASGPTSFAVTGTGLPFTVTAMDQFNNIASNYGGTVSFASSDTAVGVVLPANSPLTAGVGIFSATLQTAGNQVINASDISNPNIAGATSAIVTRGLLVTSFSPTPSGFTIAFDKPFNPSTVLMYTAGSTKDDILLATTNSQVSVRGSAIINASDTGFTFVKSDSISATGVFNAASGVLAAGNYTLTLRSLSGGNGFADSLGAALDGTDTGTGANFRITFSVSALPVAVGIPDFARGPSNTDALFLPSTLTNGSTFALSYSNPAANPTTGTATITFSTTAATLQSNIQAALSRGGLAAQIGLNASATNTPNSVVIVTNDTSTGANVLVTFQSALAQSTNQLLSSSTAGVSIGLATINVANNLPGSGIPIGLSSGLGVTSGSFTLQYNPSLLTISGTTAKAAGSSFTLLSNTINSATSATAVLSLSSPASLTSTAVPVIMGTLLATMPLSAIGTYGAKQLLHLSSEQLAGTAGPIAVTNADAVQVAAYLGDVTDLGGPLSLQDAGAIASVAGTVANTTAQTIPGFAAFPNLDPAIIGDVSLQGSVNSTDTGAMTQEVGGLARPTIPYAPIGLPVTPAGPGPALTVPIEPVATVASMVVVPAGPIAHAQSNIRDLAADRTQMDGSQPNLLSKDDLAYLWQSTSRSLLAPGPCSQLDDGQSTDVVESAGLVKVFSSDA
jgi:hypothetical protein